MLGPAHGITLKTRWRFSGVLFALGKRKEAEKEYNEALDLSQSALSLNDSTNLDTQTTRALACHVEKRHAQAAALWQHLIPLQARLLGPEHPDTLRARAALAENLDARGWHEEAEQRLCAVLPLQQRVLGALHPDTLNTCRSLAECLQAQHKTQEAQPWARRALAGSQQVFGPDHLDTRLCQHLVDTLMQPGSPAAPPHAPPQEDRPVATVDGTPILASDLRTHLQEWEEALRRQYSDAPQKLAEETAKIKRTALDTLIDQQLLADELPRIGGRLDPALIEQDLNRLIEEVAQGDRAAFETALARAGLTMEKFRAARQRLISSDLMRVRIADQVEITRETVRDYYQKHPQHWGQEEVRLHSLTIPETLHQTDAATRRHIESLRTRIIQGTDFTTLARAESKDSHAEDGGAWDWTPVSVLSEKVRAALAQPPKGAVSPVIEQNGTLTILRVEDRRLSAPPPYDKVEKEAAQLLKQELGEERIERTLLRLRAAADIQKMETSLARRMTGKIPPAKTYVKFDTR